MGYFYVDDSLHDDAGFIICACVYSEVCLNEVITGILTDLSYDPLVDEYKSSINHAREEKRIELRKRLRGLLSQCKLGIVVLPRENREQIGFECLKGIKQFIVYNNLENIEGVYLDQSMFTLNKDTRKAIEELGVDNVHVEQDSTKVKGIQLADLAAHTASIAFKIRTGKAKEKMILRKEEFDYVDIELSFELWHITRYPFFREKNKKYNLNDSDIEVMIENHTFKVEPYGLYISSLCNKELSESAREYFGYVYLGCTR